MRLQDTVSVQGILSYRVRRRGVVVEEVEGENLVVDVPRNQLARLVAGDGPAPAAINRIGFGTDGTAAAGGNAALAGPFLKLIAGKTYPAVGEVRFAWVLAPEDANGMSIREFGLIGTDGSLFSRKTRAGAIEKDADVDLEGTWTIKF